MSLFLSKSFLWLFFSCFSFCINLERSLAFAQDAAAPIENRPNSSATPQPAPTNPRSTPPETTSPANNTPRGEALVSIDFPNGVNLSDVIKTVGVWTGKNFVLGQGVSGSTKISIISPEPVTREEAYQAFLSALNIAGFTTVETGKIIKILPIATARSSNIKTYYGENWSPATDEIINQVVPLHYIDANSVISQLRPILGTTQFTAFTTTNSLILTDTGNRIRRILEVVKLLDSKSNQAQVSIVPINYMDAKDAATKVTDIFLNKSGPSLSLQKALVDERTNSLILVGPSRGLDDVVRFIQRIDTPTFNEGGQVGIRVRTLDYADAEKLAQTLQALTQNTTANRSRPPYASGASSGTASGAPQSPQAQVVADLAGVKITADKATNSLIIQGTKAVFEELESIIAKLDRRRAQVYVEADIVDMSINNGLLWSPSALGGFNAGGDRYTVPFGFNAAQAVPFTVTEQNSSTDPSSLLGSVGSQNAILGILSNNSIDIGGFSLTPGALLFALKTDTNSNVLQTPSTIVADNETANFESSQQYSVNLQIANPNGSGSVTQSQRYDVVTSLKVTPQISRADFVTMKMNLQLDDAIPPGPGGSYPNPISKRSAESVVTVQNGQTAILGGLTQDRVVKSESKVPFLGDIPILGWLFKSVNNSVNKTNLTVFITPHIVRDSNDLAYIYEEKINDRDNFLKAFYGNRFKDEEFYQSLPTPEQGKAPPAPNIERSSLIESQDSLNPQGNLSPQELPSTDPSPIIAPSTLGGGGGAPTSGSAGTSNQGPPALPTP